MQITRRQQARALRLEAGVQLIEKSHDRRIQHLPVKALRTWGDDKAISVQCVAFLGK
jgi:hypothetical protein